MKNIIVNNKINKIYTKLNFEIFLYNIEVKTFMYN